MPFPEVIDTRSTISAPAGKHDKHDNEDVPDFTEFKLEGFKMNSSSEITPAPHRLREARRSLVLYLEPNPGTPIQTSLQAYQDKTFVEFGPNQAHNTQPHISILGRILIERGSDFSTKWSTVEELIETIDREIKKHHLRPPEFTGFEIFDKPTKSLVMNVRLNKDYGYLTREIINQMKNKCSVLEASPMDRLHLAYNVLKSVSKPTLKRMKDKAEATIDFYDWVKTGGSWRLTLYEVMVESQVVGVRHQMTELKSWPIQTIQTNEFKLSSTLPVSLRVKLSFISSWFKNSTFMSAKKIVMAQQPTNAMVLRNKKSSDC
ncbi:uncharacterized protein B0P05DRAFT_567662 [Gilbertella persicaria]|uniref:uncharacterized protein n=1 Tax=Gilbertella persicaria TaxID=101096 RepID=UPI002220BB14|nr:uncharacterized protein B0P05DRAFT_567662 [Gilbertella persicaria]KAI8098300.1 hypothetical protein B0P05DRAFT_567662 [Gilbertella persicaria]